jgi:SAM-dependent methyltransferase
MSQETQAKVTRYWNQVASEFDTIYSGKKGLIKRFLDHWLRKDIYQRFDWVMKRSGDVSGKTICDIGCGSGRFVSAFALRGAAHVTGVDVAPEMLKLAKELVEREKTSSRCDFILGDILNAKLQQPYDITIAIGLWDYIPDPTERLSRIRDATSGKFLSAWPRKWTWRAPVRKLRLALLGCPVYFFSRTDVHRYLEAAGFRVTLVDVVGKLYCVEAELV